MIRRPPRSTRTDTLFPYTTLFRSYPWPQRPAGLVEEAFGELAKRWRPILDAFDEQGVDLAYEIHPGEDLHDGVTFERFLAGVDNHPRANILYDPSHYVLQALDYLQFRSEERRVGKECVSTCRSRGSPYN